MSRPQESLHTNSLDASGFSTSQQTKQTNHVLCLRRHGSIDALAMVLAKGAEDLVHSWVSGLPWAFTDDDGLPSPCSSRRCVSFPPAGAAGQVAVTRNDGLAHDTADPSCPFIPIGARPLNIASAEFPEPDAIGIPLPDLHVPTCKFPIHLQRRTLHERSQAAGRARGCTSGRPCTGDIRELGIRSAVRFACASSTFPVICAS